ncbi:cysteine peptidase family C39 domain-containing protein [Fulvivirga lutea]|uniref:Peptidase-C39 like family protein n=1 Tax=Fulvivirga lutea TaxID=2810512 RepID=A0A974WIK4_9BACT|nr:peptidase-C39 like family protein [Fulvivirga lutea]QSE97867.1 peptidase-C39 like family protein [Fulvivirga lutea]
MLDTANPLSLNIKKQPDDVTCGPTCLQAVYNYFGDDISLTDVISEVKQLRSGGTLGVLLGNHALSRGYKVTIYTYNLSTFDPSWFKGDVDISAKLKLQLAAKPKAKKLKTATKAYLKFLSNGGEIKFEELTPSLLKSFLSNGVPVLTGLSATFLYESPREIGDFEIQFDDIKGSPSGHFVVINGFDHKEAFVADPLESNPISEKQYYKVSFHKLINSIMLGVMTYDANLLIIHPKNIYA